MALPWPLAGAASKQELHTGQAAPLQLTTQAVFHLGSGCFLSKGTEESQTSLKQASCLASPQILTKLVSHTSLLPHRSRLQGSCCPSGPDRFLIKNFRTWANHGEALAGCLSFQGGTTPKPQGSGTCLPGLFLKLSREVVSEHPIGWAANRSFICSELGTKGWPNLFSPHPWH